VDYLVRRWRVEAVLWVCYWNALERDDWLSIRYCADHSLLLSAFWLVMPTAFYKASFTKKCNE
jgi:hypothetical protein